MRWTTLAVCAVCLLGLATSIPLPETRPETLLDQTDVQERLRSLQLDEPSTLEQVTRDKRTIAVLRQLFPGLSQQTELNPEDENQLAGAESQQNEVRVQYTGEEEEQDQDSAASGGNNAPDPAAAEVVSDDSAADESDRNKRLINFSLGGGASAGSSGGSGGGSGNFLFDIIRLVAGSGNTESSDGGVVAEAGVEKDDGYQAGIPGPITRLFVIANRGIANLMQDLILRLAQTTERIVNFKARLITSII